MVTKLVIRQRRKQAAIRRFFQGGKGVKKGIYRPECFLETPDSIFIFAEDVLTDEEFKLSQEEGTRLGLNEGLDIVSMSKSNLP